MIPINASTVAVETEAELRTYVADSNINYIYLANNITITDGITIAANKASLVIDGEYPINSGATNQFTDVNNSDYEDTIGIRSTSNITLTFKNMIINGRNYYGVPYIAENILGRDTSGVTVIYDNVTYTGPQITYNLNGLTRYIDCDITIRQTGASVSEEVGEVNRVEIGGTTRITHTDVDDAVFWFRGEPSTMSFTILAGANVEIESQNSYFMYNMLPVIGTAYPLPYVVQPNAKFSLQVSKGISYDNRNQMSSFLVDENAEFHYAQTANNGTAASVYINGALTVRQGARFYMEAANSTASLVQFTNGTNRSLSVDNPFSFVLYCANNSALASAGTTQVLLNGGQLNTWTVPRAPVTSAGGFDDTPEFKWFKKEYASSVMFTGTFTQAATTVTSNLTADDEPYEPITNLHLHQVRVISIGDWPILINPIEDDGRPITGAIEPGANLRVKFTVGTTEYTVEGSAGADGRFTINTPVSIPAGTVVTIDSNIPFLIKSNTAIAIAAGELFIVSAPIVIEYKVPPISTSPILLPRVITDEPVVVEDNRADESRWQLLASVIEPFQTEFGDVLPDAVVFVETAGGTPVVLSSTPTVVYTGGPGITPTNVFWPEPQGILIQVTRPMRLRLKYTSHVIWDLQTLED